MLIALLDESLIVGGLRSGLFLEINFPIEFIVQGTPVSAQAKRSASRDEWKGRVKDSSVQVMAQPHFVSDHAMAVTLYYFPDGPMRGDVDNIVKLTIDALIRHVYFDDTQVERVVVQKFEPGNLFGFGSPSPTLVRAMAARKPVLYVRVSDNPFEELA